MGAASDGSTGGRRGAAAIAGGLPPLKAAPLKVAANYKAQAAKLERRLVQQLSMLHVAADEYEERRAREQVLCDLIQMQEVVMATFDSQQRLAEEYVRLAKEGRAPVWRPGQRHFDEPPPAQQRHIAGAGAGGSSSCVASDTATTTAGGLPSVTAAARLLNSHVVGNGAAPGGRLSYVAGLMASATPAHLARIMAMTAADWEQYKHDHFARLVVLLELVNRPSAAEFATAADGRGGAGAGGGGGGGGGHTCHHHYHHHHHVSGSGGSSEAATAISSGGGRGACPACGSSSGGNGGGGAAADGGSGTGRGAAAAAGAAAGGPLVSGADDADTDIAAADAASVEAMDVPRRLREVVDEGIVLSFLALFHNHLPICSAGSNPDLPQRVAPHDHWRRVARRMQLTERQMLQLRIVTEEFARLNRACAADAERLSADSLAPSLLLATEACIRASEAAQRAAADAQRAAAAAAAGGEGSGGSGGAGSGSGSGSGGVGSCGAQAAAAAASGGSAGGAEGSAATAAAVAATATAATPAAAASAGGAGGPQPQQQPQQEQAPAGGANGAQPQQPQQEQEPLSDALARNLRIHVLHMTQVGMFVFNTLSRVQVAHMTVSSYPYYPLLTAIAEAAGELYDERRRQRAAAGAPTVPRDPSAAAAAAAAGACADADGGGGWPTDQPLDSRRFADRELELHQQQRAALLLQQQLWWQQRLAAESGGSDSAGGGSDSASGGGGGAALPPSLAVPTLLLQEQELERQRQQQRQPQQPEPQHPQPEQAKRDSSPPHL